MSARSAAAESASKAGCVLLCAADNANLAGLYQRASSHIEISATRPALHFGRCFNSPLQRGALSARGTSAIKAGCVLLCAADNANPAGLRQRASSHNEISARRPTLHFGRCFNSPLERGALSARGTSAIKAGCVLLCAADNANPAGLYRRASSHIEISATKTALQLQTKTRGRYHPRV